MEKYCRACESALKADALIDDDAQQPGAQRSRFAQAGEMLPCLDERVLYSILRHISIFHNTVGGTQHQSTVPVEDIIKGVFIPSQCTGCQYALFSRQFSFRLFLLFSRRFY